ncbi:Lon family ATP-dependent protease [Pelotomaculum terephthalicicum JT]|uniref:Lon family ATP-dependent protease n=1 Tax=Pelotomaculum TaxID=191373 RepID=UPI0009CA42E9|nr:MULTISPECIES: Lon family ATP-dependent protease [Pelotomaculum]MCG9969009.1 Lon family ATP-dependent protease [Pelotomaculum terephthalicicum JT]OPX91387.1 MAG: Lon protease 2 [Pelotomaculum sp. PtaB.Bin117]OPY58957.1 MAG: Lon protease 2 [Pelotomaculum sp. PtaU1.Bin065]
MKAFLEKCIGVSKKDTTSKLKGRHKRYAQLKRQVNVLYDLLANLYGSDKLVLRAGKLEALQLMRSEKLEERVLALQKLVFDDPTYENPPALADIPPILEQIEEEIADSIARRTVEDQLERKVSERLQQKHEDYIKEIKIQVLKDNAGPENAQTLKKLAVLEKLEQKNLSSSAMDFLRPASFGEIVGQDRAIKALLAKLSSPYPQHVILYGPPGVGKTTAARLALEAAKRAKKTPFAKDAPFVEVNGTTLRWDPREVTNPLLGSVHDPIYQGARRDLADTGIPEPKLGLVTDAHGGVLFIDEIGEMDPILQNKLLKVLEDKRVFFESSYYDAHENSIPQYIRKIFEEGAPADFIFIGATTRDPLDLNPAIRSRCAEIYFEPLTPKDIQEILKQAAVKLNVEMDGQVPEIIGEYTIEGRKAINILADAFGLACYRSEQDGALPVITIEDVLEVVQVSRLSPHVTRKASSQREVGKLFGLGVLGFLGSVLEIEAVAFPARNQGQGAIRFNDTAGSMAKDSVFNAASVIRKLTGEDLANYDVHVNVVGGGRIDGPSAGAAIFLAVLSAIQCRSIPQDVAVTGEVSIQGKVRAVGGVFEKIYGARQAGIKTVLVPYENKKDIPADLKGIRVIPVNSVEEMMSYVFQSADIDVLVS